MAEMNRAKVLLMGRAKAGKTSMKSIIFANYMARETKNFLPTYQVEQNSVKFMGNRGLSLWDCGGQDRFMENYFESQKDMIFDRVEVMIYVVTAEGPDKKGRSDNSTSRDFGYFRNAMEALSQRSPNATVFCLIHKMDLVHESRREEVLNEYKKMIDDNAHGFKVTSFGTSIWDASLFKAWSQIVHMLIPEMAALQTQLDHVCKVCEADEVVLFEQNTFLLIANASTRTFTDNHRFEKLSNIVKQFKLSCAKMKQKMDQFTVTNVAFNAVVEQFLDHSFIMVVASTDRVRPAAISVNLAACRKHFGQLKAETESGMTFGTHL